MPSQLFVVVAVVPRDSTHFEGLDACFEWLLLPLLCLWLHFFGGDCSHSDRVLRVAGGGNKAQMGCQQAVGVHTGTVRCLLFVALFKGVGAGNGEQGAVVVECEAGDAGRHAWQLGQLLLGLPIPQTDTTITATGCKGAMAGVGVCERRAHVQQRARAWCGVGRTLGGRQWH